jgi:hypothetical protein
MGRKSSSASEKRVYAASQGGRHFSFPTSTHTESILLFTPGKYVTTG